MEAIQKVLRPRKPKTAKPLPLTNAERCRRYKEKIKQDPIAYENFKKKKKVECEQYLTGLSDEQKLLKKEKDRLRQRKYREKQKNSKQQNPQKKTVKIPSKSTTCTPTSKIKTRVEYQKEAEKKKKNMESQRRRRACMSSQKISSEREKRMEYYYNRKNMGTMAEPEKKKTSRIRLSSLLNGVVRT